MLKQVALVTGTSSGIGLETSKLLAEKGFLTFGGIRNLNDRKLDVSYLDKSLEFIDLDVTSQNSVTQSIQKIIRAYDRIDIVVNNAGYGSFGPIEDISFDEIKRQFETNFFGSVRVIKEVLPIMRKQRAGLIINVSSISGRIAFPFSSVYSASKFAIEGLSESLAYELDQFGIKIILIEPGVVRSNFSNNLYIPSISSDQKYKEMMTRFGQGFDSITRKYSNSPKYIAEVIVNSILNESNNLRITAGPDTNALIQKRRTVNDIDFQSWLLDNILNGKGFVS